MATEMEFVSFRDFVNDLEDGSESDLSQSNGLPIVIGNSDVKRQPGNTLAPKSKQEEISDSLLSINSSLYGAHPKVVSGYYFNASQNAIIAASAFSYVALEMKAGDYAMITTARGSTTAVVCFAFVSNGSVVYQSGSVSSYVNYRYDATSDGVLYVNTKNSTLSSFKAYKNSIGLDAKVQAEKNEVDLENLFGNIVLESGHYYGVNSSTTHIRNREDNVIFKTRKIKVNAGEKYVVTATGSAVALPLSAYNVNGDLIFVSSTESLSSYSYTTTADGWIIVNALVSRAVNVYRETKYDSKILTDAQKVAYYTLGEMYSLDGTATYTDGLIDSPVAVIFPDGSHCSLHLTRNSDGLVTKIIAMNSDYPKNVTIQIGRDSEGNAVSTTIS